MLAEFKKDTTLKEFTELSEQLDRGRQLQNAIKIESAQQIAVSDNPNTPYSISSAEVSNGDHGDAGHNISSQSFWSSFF